MKSLKSHEISFHERFFIEFHKFHDFMKSVNSREFMKVGQTQNAEMYEDQMTNIILRVTQYRGGR